MIKSLQLAQQWWMKLNIQIRTNDSSNGSFWLSTNPTLLSLKNCTHSCVCNRLSSTKSTFKFDRRWSISWTFKFDERSHTLSAVGLPRKLPLVREGRDRQCPPGPFRRLSTPSDTVRYKAIFRFRIYCTHDSRRITFLLPFPCCLWLWQIPQHYFGQTAPKRKSRLTKLEQSQISTANTERKLGWCVVTVTTILLIVVSLGTAFYTVITPGLAPEVVVSLLVFILGLFWVVSKYVFPYFSAPYSRIAEVAVAYEPDLESGFNESRKNDW